MNLHAVQERIGIPPELIVDVGANTGGFYNEARKEWPEASWLLIEGNPECEPALQMTEQPYTITLLSDAEKEVDFYTRAGSPCCTGASIYREDTVFYRGDNAVPSRRKTDTLDRVMAAFMPDADHILMKLDVQGAELDVLRGATETLKKTSAIICEVGFLPYNEGAPMEREVTEWLAANGFRKAEELQVIVHPIERTHIQSDYLYLKDFRAA